MSRFPCEYCRGTGIRSGEPIPFSNDWTPDEPCTCVTMFTLQELIIISRILRVENNVLHGYGSHGQIVGMRDDLWEQLLDKIRTGHEEDR